MDRDGGLQGVGQFPSLAASERRGEIGDLRRDGERWKMVERLVGESHLRRDERCQNLGSGDDREHSRCAGMHTDSLMPSP